MIKKLRLKFVLVFLVLVVSVFITSSCYAVENYTYSDFEITIDKEAKTLYVLHTPSNKSVTYDISYGLNNYTNYYFQVNNYITSTSSSLISQTNFGLVFSDNLKWKTYNNTYNNTTQYIYGSSSSYCYYFKFDYYNDTYPTLTKFSLPWGSTCGFSEGSSTYYQRGEHALELDSNYNYKYGDVEILTASHTITAPNGTELYKSGPSVFVDVKHEFQADTSAKVTFDYSSYGTDYVLKYSLSGIEINMDLTAPITLKNPIIYSPGVTNLVVSPNTKVYWVLYDSNGASVESDVYQVPEYDFIVENENKQIKYEITYSEDFTYAILNAYLENGSFSDKLVYSEFMTMNPTTRNVRLWLSEF